MIVPCLKNGAVMSDIEQITKYLAKHTGDFPRISYMTGLTQQTLNNIVKRKYATTNLSTIRLIKEYRVANTKAKK